MLALGLLLLGLRLDEELAPGWHAALLGTGAALAGWLAAAAPNEGGRPPAYRSVELVCAVGLLGCALLRIIDDSGPGRICAAAALFAAVCLLPAIRARSAVCGLLAALSWVVAVLAGATWLFDAGPQAYRWLLTGAAAALVLWSLWLRAGWPRHAILLIDAAGLCVLGIAASFVSVDDLSNAAAAAAPAGWEALLLACGCGLVAFGAVEREPTPAGLGIAVLASFVGLAGTGGGGVLVWPVVLLTLGAGVLLAALRPARPLPPDPDGEAPPAEVRSLR